MRPRTLLVVVALFAALVTGQQTTGRAAVADLSGSPVVPRASVAQLSTDAGTPLRTCDPNKPAVGFSVEHLQPASVPGFSGIVYQGEVISHCNTSVKDVSLVALIFRTDGALVGTTSLRTDFGLIGPGQGSPFVVLAPVAPANVASIAVMAVRFTTVSGPVPILELRRGTTSVSDSGTSVPFEIRNNSSAVASLPRIAGRILGAGCGSPYALEFLRDGAPLAAGATISGTLFIPSSCAGVAEINAGSDAPVPAGLPPGLSLAAARTFYTPDGVLHLVANVCNGSAPEAFLPQFRVQFAGATPTTVTLRESGIYSGYSCAPLLATVPGAPAGLTFEKLISTAQVEAQSVAPEPRPDLPMDIFDYIVARIRRDCSTEDLREIARNSVNSGINQFISDECQTALALGAFAPIFATSGHSQRAVGQASEPATILTFLYNGSDAPLSSSAYRVQTLGYGRDGALLAGIDIASPPSLPARGWAIGATPLDATSVVALDGDEFRIDGEGFAIPK